NEKYNTRISNTSSDFPHIPPFPESVCSCLFPKVCLSSWRILLPCTFLAEATISIVSCLFILLKFSSRSGCCILAYFASPFLSSSSFHLLSSIRPSHLYPDRIFSVMVKRNSNLSWSLSSFVPSPPRAVCYCFSLNFLLTVNILRKCR
ncbi:hypothetical protein CSUI_004403, partial [Cystoisospora suis]